MNEKVSLDMFAKHPLLCPLLRPSFRSFLSVSFKKDIVCLTFASDLWSNIILSFFPLFTHTHTHTLSLSLFSFIKSIIFCFSAFKLRPQAYPCPTPSFPYHKVVNCYLKFESNFKLSYSHSSFFRHFESTHSSLGYLVKRKSKNWYHLPPGLSSRIINICIKRKRVK